MQVNYDPKLIATLRKEHAHLEKTFERIKTAAQSGNFNEVRQLLVHLKSALQAHILTENVRLYSYIGNLSREDPEQARRMYAFRTEMNTIAREVVAFVKRYQKCDFSSRREREMFASDYKVVGARLEQRLTREENDLYPLYRPI
jgi:roadblock/LC7 domain-containing protein